ncbi:MAG: Gldg family protein [Verrucomicrobia bacterium]|nr:Gldg family protein [Verrucomicrobiota bacterium]
MNKKLETLMFSAAGVVAMFVIFIGVNLIVSASKSRVDLTAEQLYTPSDGTKKILGRLDTPVKVRFYCTQGENAMPVPLKTFAARVEDLLAEYRSVAHGKITVEKLDPQPDSDAEDSANIDGVEGQPLQTGEKIYLGISVSCLDQKVALPFLAPDREKLLEYDLSRAIARAVNPTKPIIGVMTALPMFGQPVNPMMMRMGQTRGQEPWVFINELKRDFDVKQVPLTADKIDDDIKVLLVVHPRDITDAAQYALDQFVLRGGKLIAFVDPVNVIDAQQNGGNPMMGGGPPSGSTLDKLFKAWGVEFDKTKVVADPNFITTMRGRSGRPEKNPCWLSLDRSALAEDSATFQIDNLLLAMCGAFTGTPAEGLQQKVLIKSTADAALAEGFLAQMSAEAVLKDLKPAGKEYALAIRLSGKFKTAFPDGKPKDKADEAEKPDEKKDAKKDEKKPDGSLTQSKDENFVILVADSDILYHEFSMRMLDGFNMMIPFNANLSLAQNMVEQLSGDTSLINARTRASMSRPFERVRKMQAQAEESYRGKIEELEKSRQEAERKLNELMQNKDKTQRFVLSPEQQKEIEEFKKKRTEMNQELKLIRKNLRHDVDKLENQLKWLNIAGMPLLVTVGGISLALVKRKRTAAK